MTKVSMPASRAAEFYLFGSRGGLPQPLPPNIKVCRQTEADKIVQNANKRIVFISFRQSSTVALLKSGLMSHRARTTQLLTLEPPPADSVPSLMGVFGVVLGFGRGSRWLPVGELVKVITGSDAANRFICGAADFASQSVALIKGNRETLVLPFSAFEPSGDGTVPDFTRLGFTDYGHTVVLGDYEASADAILYEEDAAYRRKLNKERIKSEKSYGASVRRLRLQRKLTQDDFSPLSKKTISRIERNEVEKPHGKTLNVLAQRLGVEADAIETF